MTAPKIIEAAICTALPPDGEDVGTGVTLVAGVGVFWAAGFAVRNDRYVPGIVK